MSQDEYARHLRLRALELQTLPLKSIHEPTQMPVWLLLSLVIDARSRVELGRLG